MLGYLGYRAVRGQWRMYQRSRKAPGGPWTFTAVLFCVLPLTVLWMLTAPFQHKMALFAVLLGVNTVLCGLVALPVWARRVTARNVLKRYQPKPGALSASRVDSRIALLDELEAQRLILADRAAHPHRPELTLRVFAAACPVTQCLAPPGTACAMGVAIPVALVGERPVEFCHLERMRSAVEQGFAEARDILTQFGNNAPRRIFG